MNDDVPHARYLTRRRAQRMSESIRAGLVRAPLVDDIGRHPRTQIVGHDPVRVLLFGSGPLVGYHVRTREEAVDGHLARMLADRLRRGVSVENRVRLGLPIDEAVRSLGGSGTATFSVAIWSPRFGQELQRGRPTASRASLRAMLQEFRAASDVPLIVCHLPIPIGTDWRSLLRRPRVMLFNRVIDQEVAQVRNVAAVPLGTYRPAEWGELGTEWLRSLAERLLPEVLAALHGGRHPAGAVRG